MADQIVTKEIYRLTLQSGAWKDYTTFSAPGCVDMQWFRFYHKRLKKIGGYKFIGKLNAYTLDSDFKAYDSPYGNPFTQPSYPNKQYSNQDLSKPWDSANLTSTGQPYDQYDFNSGQDATYFAGVGISEDGYGVPRKIISVNQDSLNKIVITSDYNQNMATDPALYGGIAFGNVQPGIDPTNFVNGLFPKGFGYVPNTSYLWSIDFVNLTTGFDLAATSTLFVTHSSCATQNISDSTNYYVFLVPAVSIAEGVEMSPLSANTSNTDLICNTEVSVSGGVCSAGPFLFAYGNNGLIMNSDVNNPLKWANPGSAEWQANPGLANSANVTNTKIVKGINYRGAGNYAALFWSLDSLILGVFVGSPVCFSYSILATNISIIAPNSVIEQSGAFFWIGDGRFFVFQGGNVAELPNMQNRNWFFSNINRDYQHRTFSVLNPQYNEIWWVFPLGSSTECNWVLIYNYEENVFYDTPLKRGAGVYSSIIAQPIMIANEKNTDENAYDVFLHEEGVDYVDKNNQHYGIYSSFTTGDLGFLSSPAVGGGKSPQQLLQNWLNLIRVEFDALFSKVWNIQFLKRTWVNDAIKESDIYSFGNNAEATSNTKLDIREQSRIMQMKVFSQAENTDFYQGDFMLTANVGDCEGI